MNQSEIKDGKITSQVVNGINTITFHHPKKNSLPSQLLKEFAQSIQQASKDEKTKVIVINSIGNVFCAGASFDELLQIKDEHQGYHFFTGFAFLIEAMLNSPKLIVTQIQGKAVGGAMGIIAASDYAIASEQAAFKLSELSIGIGPYVIAPVVISKIGKSKLRQMTLENEWKTAQWALNSGLIQKVVRPELLETEVNHRAQQFLKYDLDTATALKTYLLEGEKELTIEKMKANAKLSGSMILSEYSHKKLGSFFKK